MKLRRRKLPFFNKLLNERMTSSNKPDGIENFMAKITQPDNFHDYVIGRTAHDLTREAPLLRQISQFLASKNARLQGNEFVTEPYVTKLDKNNKSLLPEQAIVTVSVQFCEKLAFIPCAEHVAADSLLLSSLISGIESLRKNDQSCKDLRVSSTPVALAVSDTEFQYRCSFMYGNLKLLLTLSSSDPEIIYFFHNAVETPIRKWWKLTGYVTTEE
jgi:hypothetical protein